MHSRDFRRKSMREKGLRERTVLKNCEFVYFFASIELLTSFVE